MTDTHVDCGDIITSAADIRLLDASNYTALALSGPIFRGIVATASLHGARIVDATDAGTILDGDAAVIDLAQVQRNTALMLTSASGERFPVGSHDLVVLRYLVDGVACSILYVEDYPLSYPCIASGHITDRHAAIQAWLGDASPSDHPGLCLG